MSEAFDRYCALLKKMKEVRTAHGDQDSEEENTILDQMDGVWRQLTDEEMEQLNKLD